MRNKLERKCSYFFCSWTKGPCMVNQKNLEITGNTWKYQEKYLVILEKYLEIPGIQFVLKFRWLIFADYEILIISWGSILLIVKSLFMFFEEREAITSKLRGWNRSINHIGYFIFHTTKYNIHIRCYSQFGNSNAFPRWNHAE